MSEMNVFSHEYIETAKEKGGLKLAAQDAMRERHEKKKSEEDYFLDFMHNLNHPFMGFVIASAEKHVKEGSPFVLHAVITVLINTREDARVVFYQGDAWRNSGNALITKYLKEAYPNLIVPKMQLWTKGTQMLLDAYPDRYVWLRDALKERLEEEVQ